MVVTYRAASRGLQKSKFSDPPCGRNVGETMLLPSVILTLTLCPVLIPALVTAFHLVANRLRVVRARTAALVTDG
jgi:hypothetical protein